MQTSCEGTPAQENAKRWDIPEQVGLRACSLKKVMGHNE